jgi:hypothetical protein
MQVTSKIAKDSSDSATALSQKLGDPTVINTQLVKKGLPAVRNDISQVMYKSYTHDKLLTKHQGGVEHEHSNLGCKAFNFLLK